MKTVSFTQLKSDTETTGYRIGDYRLTPDEFLLFAAPFAYAEISPPVENIFGSHSYTVTGQAVFAEDAYLALKAWQKAAPAAVRAAEVAAGCDMTDLVGA